MDDFATRYFSPVRLVMVWSVRDGTLSSQVGLGIPRTALVPATVGHEATGYAMDSNQCDGRGFPTLTSQKARR